MTIHGPDARVREDWYVRLNPNARVPTIDDDGFVMWESAAINFYLARKYRSPLWPDSIEGEGRALQWMLYMANDVEPLIVTLLQNRVQLPPEQRDPARDAAADDEMQPRLRVMEEQLSRTPYFGGDRWDLSDFMVASIAFSFFTVKYDLSTFPRFDAWFKSTMARPATQYVIKLRG